MKDTLKEFQTLVEIVAKLRGPDGCPWDKEQTQSSLCQYVLEEAFELVEAIESGKQKDICDELGDYLFQVILQSQVAKDEDHFALSDVLKNVNEKLIERHPHVFGEAKAKDSEEVWRNWHQMKNAEGAKKKRPVFSYPKNLPALQAAHKIGKKTEGYRFDWENETQVLAKVREELQETVEVLGDKKKLQHEIGDLLFSVAQLARHTDIDPEAALREANRRFEGRFLKVLELSGKDQQSFADLSSEEKEELWRKVKAQEI
jgi:tetrapyrrole methylase family protein / MazG family protein